MFKWLCNYTLVALATSSCIFVSDHCNLEGLLAALHASLAILPLEWVEEVSQILCKTRQIKEKTTCQHQTTQSTGPQLGYASLGCLLWAGSRARGWIFLQHYVCKKILQLESKKKQVLERPWKKQKLGKVLITKGENREWRKGLLLLITIVLWGRQAGLHQGYRSQLLFIMEITWQIPSISYPLRGEFLLIGHLGE